ncbi:MAG: hypothetical protein WKF84_27630 [Pyrinomonadaceae bacterium]
MKAIELDGGLAEAHGALGYVEALQLELGRGRAGVQARHRTQPELR